MINDTSTNILQLCCIAFVTKGAEHRNICSELSARNLEVQSTEIFD